MASTPSYVDAAVEVHQLSVGPVDNNVYIVRCRATGEAVMIDAANEHERLLELCTELGVRRVVETHGHWDHIAAVPQVRDAGYQVAVSVEDAAMLDGYDETLTDGERLRVGRVELEVIHTPGHTPGSLCFYVPGTPLLFTGDTLFPGGPGATHFPGGDFTSIIDSIERRIFARFGPETRVLPGHGRPTTVGAESPELEAWVARGW